MKAVLTTLGKFHSFDLARQLQAHGALEVIYSGYPRFKLRHEGLPRERVRTFPYLHAPYMASGWRDRLGLGFLRQWEYWDRTSLDAFVARTLPDADVFVGLSGCGLATGREARRRGMKVFCDRGSTHIRHQNEVLLDEHRRWGLAFPGVDPRIIDREEAEYAAADVVTVPSTFVRDTFVARGVPAAKVQLLSYGVDLDRFHPVAAPAPGRFDVLFVGGVSLRKGVPCLLKAYQALDHPKKSLTIAGVAEDAVVAKMREARLLPADATLLGHVPQPDLKALMSRSHVLVLPSIEEGLAMVMAQALACGCPVVASRNTGAEDLFHDGVEGYIVEAQRDDRFAERLEALADDPALQARMRAAALERVRSIGGWSTYGENAIRLYGGPLGDALPDEPPMSLSVLYLGPMSGTSRHRRDAFLRLGHRVTTVEPRRLLPDSAWVDRIEWHLSPSLPGALLPGRLDDALDGQRFDLAFVDGGSLLTPRSIRRLRERCARVVNFNHDDPFGPRDGVRFSAYRAAVPDYDLVVVVRPTNVDEARRAGARQVLLHPMVSDEVAHAPREITPAVRARWHSDVAFIGSWMPERGPFLRELAERGVPLAIYGPGWQKAPEWPRLKPLHRAEYLDGDDYAHAVQCAEISLGLLSKGNRDLHTTRSMEIPALGGVLCAERTAEHRAFYREGEEAAFWNDAAECAAVCRTLLADEPGRRRMAALGRRRSLANGYTSEQLIRRTLAALTA